jgi:hypothetical protein
MAKKQQVKPIFIIRVPIKPVTDLDSRTKLEENLKQLSSNLASEYYTIFLADNSVSRIEFEVLNTSATELEIEELKHKLLGSFENSNDD